MGPYGVFATVPVTVRIAAEPAVPLGFPAGLAGVVTPVAAGVGASAGAAEAAGVAGAAGPAAAALAGPPAPAGLPGVPAAGTDVPGVPAAETPELTGWVLNDRSAARPAMVPPRVRTARRMSFLRFLAGGVGGQKSNDSWWMRRRRMPAARSESTAALVMPGGPQT